MTLELEWSRDTAVPMPDGTVAHVFMLNTYAVRAVDERGSVVIVLPRGAAAGERGKRPQYVKDRIWPLVEEELAALGQYGVGGQTVVDLRWEALPW
jgi:hypothetical protein